MSQGKGKLKRVSFWENSEDRRLHLFIGFILTLILFLILYFSYPPIFYSNDDYRMRALLSGAYMGVSSTNGVFISAPLSYLLNFLYNTSPSVNWYGFGTMGTFFLSIWAILVLFIKERPRQSVILLFPTIILFFSLHIMLPQYTIITAVSALAFFLLILESLNRVSKGEFLFSKSYFAVCSFFFVATVLNRMNVFFLFGLYFAVYIIFDFRNFITLLFAQGKKYFLLFIVFTLIFAGVFFYQRYVQINEYGDYTEYNWQRSMYYDYYRDGSTYEKSKDLYQSLGISQDVFNLLYHRFYDIDPQLNARTLEKISEGLHQQKLASYESVFQRWSDSLYKVIRAYGRHRIRWSFLGLILISLTVFVDLLRVQRGKDILRLICIAGLTLGLSVYFMDAGRLIDRLQWTMILFAVFPLYFTWLRKRRWGLSLYKVWILTAMVLALTYLNIQSVEPTYQRMDALGRKNQDILQYTKERPDDFFFTSAALSASGSEKVLEPDLQKRNFDNLGNWIAFSPMYYQRNQSYGFVHAYEGLKDHLNVYYMDYSTGKPYLQDYFKKTYGLTSVKVDEFQVTDYDASSPQGRGKSTVSIYSFIPLKEAP